MVPLIKDADDSKLPQNSLRSECQTMWLKDLGSPEDSDLLYAPGGCQWDCARVTCGKCVPLML